MTDWNQYNTPRLWSMVANEDDPEAWRQVAAWGDMSDAVKDQRGLLENAKNKLIAAWPPGENKSSEAFVKELDTLLARMEAARAEANDTATGLANILEALRQAKNKIEPLYQQHHEKAHDIKPAWWDHAEDEIDNQARAIMANAESIVGENMPKLAVPPPYTLKPETLKDEKKSIGNLGASGTRPGSGSGGSGSSNGGGSFDYDVPHNPPPPLPTHDPRIPDGSTGADPGSPSNGTPGTGTPGGNPITTTPGVGPGLSGVITPPAGTQPGINPPGPGTLPETGGGVGTPGFIPPGVGPIAGGGGRGVGSPTRGGTALPGEGIGGGRVGGVGVPGAGGVGGRGARGVRSGIGRALPSGAVIGETVGGAGRGVAGGVGQPGVGRGGAAGGIGGGVGGRGGVAGRGVGRPGAGRSVAGAMSPEEIERNRPPRPSWLPEERNGSSSSIMSGAGRGNKRSHGDGSQPPFDPDNPWQVAEGVDPVINPAGDGGTHDPGPNVIGWRP
ncbi:hypothetical protein [Actinoplanes sp. TFC3]|uniref:hypothetical protein n=1 Tax=Actinoplanes sp. TFC3 TaxID=1710355 RepID=UPI0008337473|nr:hypothetical protein [Actinoplanes sp. TFC3]